MKVLSVLFISILITLTACQKPVSETHVELTGIIREMGSTSYHYGTHIIENGDEFYALKSDQVNLDFYLNQSVTVVGDKIEGYPIDGGPEFVDVFSIKE